MNSAAMAAAADRIRSSTHPAAVEIADLLTDTATELSHHEAVWDQCGELWLPTAKADITRWLYGRHIALAQKLTGEKVP
jgi:hypothetical protein